MTFEQPKQVRVLSLMTFLRLSEHNSWGAGLIESVVLSVLNDLSVFGIWHIYNITFLFMAIRTHNKVILKQVQTKIRHSKIYFVTTVAIKNTEVMHLTSSRPQCLFYGWKNGEKELTWTLHNTLNRKINNFLELSLQEEDELLFTVCSYDAAFGRNRACRTGR